MNTLLQLREYFGTTERPVSAVEFSAFWKSLTDEQKTYYKTVELVPTKS